MRLLVSIVVLVALAACGTAVPPPSPTDVKSVTIYNLRADHRHDYAQSELSRAASSPLDPKFFADLLGRASYSTPMTWLNKGQWFALWCSSDGKCHPIGLSFYGGIIEVFESGGLFVLSDGDRARWEDVVFKGIVEQEFGPVNKAERYREELARLPEYIQDLKSNVNLIRATDGIAGLGAEAAEATPYLIPLIQSPDLSARHNAIYALGRIGPAASAAIPDLRTALPTLSEGTKREAQNTLRLIGDGNE